MIEEVMDSSVMKSLIQQYSSYYCREVTNSILKAVNCSNFSKKYSLMNLWQEKVLLLGFLHGVESGELGLSGLLSPKLERDLVSDMHIWLPVEYSCPLEELSIHAQKARDSGLLDPSSSSILRDIIHLPKAHTSSLHSTSKNISPDEIKELSVYCDTVKTIEELMIEKIKTTFEYMNQHSRFSSKFTLQTLWPSKALFITLLYGLISHDIALCTPAFKLFSEIQSQDELEATDLKQSLLYEFKVPSEDICKANEYLLLYKCHRQGTIPDDLNNILSAILEKPMLARTSKRIDAQKILNSKISFTKSSTPKNNEESDVIEISDDEIDSKESLKKLVAQNTMYNEFNKLMENMVHTGKFQELMQKSLNQTTSNSPFKGHRIHDTPKKTKGSNCIRNSFPKSTTRRKLEADNILKENHVVEPSNVGTGQNWSTSQALTQVETTEVENASRKNICKKQVSGGKEHRRSFRIMKPGSLMQSKTTEEDLVITDVGEPHKAVSTMLKKKQEKTKANTMVEKESSLMNTEAVTESQDTVPTTLKKKKKKKNASTLFEKEFCPVEKEAFSVCEEVLPTQFKKRGRKRKADTVLEKASCPVEKEASSQCEEVLPTQLKKRGRKRKVDTLLEKEYCPVEDAFTEREKVLPIQLKKRGRKRKTDIFLEKRDQSGAASEEYTNEPVEKSLVNEDSIQPNRRNKKGTHPRSASKTLTLEKRSSNLRIKQQNRGRKKTQTKKVDPVPVHEKIAVLNKQLIEVQSEKKSLLHYAVISGLEKALVKVLKDKTTAIDSTDAHGESALHLAIRTGQDFGLVRALVELGGADVNLPTPKGHTPLHLACMRTGNLFIIKYLIQNGADHHVKDNQGKTPQDLCISKAKNNPVVSFLRSLK